MQWMRDVEDAINAADGSAVYVVALPRIRNMQIRIGLQGTQHLADVFLSRVKNLIRQDGKYRSFVRFAGMELIVVVPGIMRLGEISMLGEAIRNVCNMPVAIGEDQFGTDTNVGIAISPDDGVSAEELISRAQIAADNGGNTHAKAPVFFAGPMAKVADLACRIEIELRSAIDNRSLDIAFQPQFSLTKRRFAAAEVLVRWDHPLYGTIPPSDFIPIAESAGLVSSLGSFVLHEAIIQMDEFRRRYAPLDLAVNVSPSQLVQEDFIDEIDDLLGSVGMDYSALTIEITEGELLFDIDMAIHQLKQLRSRGVQTSIDDFGAGFSNLAYLHRLPLDQIKIDRRFVQQLSTDPRALTLLRSTIELGRGLDLQVCVEGVEDVRQLELVDQLGGDLVQGYLFSKPLAIAELASAINRRPPALARWQRPTAIRNDVFLAAH